MVPFLIRWFSSTLALAVATKLTGMSSDSPGALIGTALFFGLINAFLRPLALLLSLPLIIATLGLFILVVNAAMLALAAGLFNGFHVNGFWNAFFGAIIVSLVNWLLSLFFRGSNGEYHLITHHVAETRGMKKVEGRVIGE